MPNIESIPDESCLYNALDPYHVNFDNRPLENIIARQKMINTAVDINTDILASAKGSTGSLADRLDSSLEPSGHLIPAAVDLANHTIDAHTDTTNFVRMTLDERDKLSYITDEATNIQLTFENVVPSNSTINFPSNPLSAAVVVFANSTSASWRRTSDKMYLDVTSSPGAHAHFYDQVPANPSYDYQTYYLPFVWIDGAGGSSLRVYINGARISQDSGLVPSFASNSVSNVTWTTNSIASSDPVSQVFVLTNPITQYDLITVDFDRSLS